MKWNAEAEEALARLLEGRDLHARNREEVLARPKIEARARRDGVDEIDARSVLSTLAPDTPPEDRDRVCKVIRSLGMRPEEFL